MRSLTSALNTWKYFFYFLYYFQKGFVMILNLEIAYGIAYNSFFDGILPTNNAFASVKIMVYFRTKYMKINATITKYIITY